MQTPYAQCYRELIEYHTTTQRNPAVVCQLYKEMMQNNKELSRSDWINALQLTFQLSDQKLHREFLVALMDRYEAPDVVDELLEYDSLLLEDEELYNKALIAAAKARRNGVVVKLLRTMRRNGLRTIVSEDRNAIIKSCAIEEQWGLVLDLLAAMKDEGVVFFYTYQFVLIGCAANNCWTR